jgi:DNA-binding SARP family transcriptional activator
MTTLRLQLLGPPLAWRDQQPVRFKTRKALAAVAYLAANGGRPSREQLAALLWPDHDLAEARKNLRTTLGYIHMALGDSVLVTTHETIGLEQSTSLVMDLDLRTISRVRSLARVSDGVETGDLRGQLEEAVALYRGPFLAGFDISQAPEFDNWLIGQRTQWLAMGGELLERLSGLQAADGDLNAARRTIERWLELDPGDERAWEHLLTLGLEMGDVIGTQHDWAACQEALTDLGVEPGDSLQTLARQIDAAHINHPWLIAQAGQECACERLGPAPFVGRASQFATLRRAFARAQAGQTQLVVLHGEAGIGKTRLATEFLDWARRQGADTLMGRAFEAEGSLPFAPLVAALRSRLERENAPEDLLGDLWLTDLARLLPELRERYPDLPAAIDDVTAGPWRLYEAVARLGQSLAEHGPLILFLDDMQWADAGTRDLLRYLLRRWTESGLRAMVLVAVRLDGSGLQPAMDHWLWGLESEARTTWLEPARLAAEDVIQLVTALAGTAPVEEQAGPHESEVAAFGRWLADRTGGHPLFVTQLLLTLLDKGAILLRPAHGGAYALDVGSAMSAIYGHDLGDLVPAGLRALITAQMGRLDSTTAEVLAAGSVLGGAFSAERVLQVAAVEARKGERALDQLVRGRLLREVPETGEYRIADEWVREVLYAELGEARRQRLRRRALEMDGALLASADDAAAAPYPGHAGAQTAGSSGEQGDPACAAGPGSPAIIDIRTHRRVTAAGRERLAGALVRHGSGWQIGPAPDRHPGVKAAPGHHTEEGRTLPQMVGQFDVALLNRSPRYEHLVQHVDPSPALLLRGMRGGPAAGNESHRAYLRSPPDGRAR